MEHLELNGHDASENNPLDITDGGLIIGPGGETDDLIDACCAPGTFVLNAEAVRIVGADQLDALVNLVTVVTGLQRVRGVVKVSAGEYSIPSFVVAAMGHDFLNALNDAGVVVRSGDCASPEEAADQAKLSFDAGLRTVADIWANFPVSHFKMAGEQNFAGGGLATALGNMARGAVPVAMHMDQQEELTRRWEAGNALAQAAGQRAAAADQRSAETHDVQMRQVRQSQNDDQAVRDLLAQGMDGYQRIMAGQGDDLIEAGLKQANSAGELKIEFNQSLPDGTRAGFVSDASGAKKPIRVTREHLANMYLNRHMEQARFINPARFDAHMKAQSAAGEKQKEREGDAKIAADRNQTALDIAKLNNTTSAANTAARIGVLRERLAAEQNMGDDDLTLSQQRANKEIDAARERIASMDPAEISRRSQKATNTGRENPEYDASIARAAALAARRKIGSDDHFDQRGSGQAGSNSPTPATSPANRADVAKRFRADRTMLNRRLGAETPQGIEVFEKNKLIGYYR